MRGGNWIPPGSRETGVYRPAWANVNGNGCLLRGTKKVILVAELSTWCNLPFFWSSKIPLWNYASLALDIDPLGLGIKEDGVRKWSKRVRHIPLVTPTYILVRTMNVWFLHRGSPPSSSLEKASLSHWWYFHVKKKKKKKKHSPSVCISPSPLPPLANFLQRGSAGSSSFVTRSFNHRLADNCGTHKATRC